MTPDNFIEVLRKNGKSSTPDGSWFADIRKLYEEIHIWLKPFCDQDLLRMCGVKYEFTEPDGEGFSVPALRIDIVDHVTVHIRPKEPPMSHSGQHRIYIECEDRYEIIRNVCGKWESYFDRRRFLTQELFLDILASVLGIEVSKESDKSQLHVMGVQLPESLMRCVEHQANLEERSLDDVVVDAIKSYIGDSYCPDDTDIMVNGKGVTERRTHLSFTDVALLAFDTLVNSEGMTITYKHAGEPCTEGVLGSKQWVRVRNGTVFNVVRT